MGIEVDDQRLAGAAGRDSTEILIQPDAIQCSHHQKGVYSTDNDDISNLRQEPEPQSSSTSRLPGASYLKDERGRRLSRGTFLAVDNDFHTSQVGHFGKPTPSVQVSAPGEQPRTPTDDEEHSRAPSRHSDFKSITTIDDFGFGIGLTRNNRPGSWQRASSDSLHPHYLSDEKRVSACQQDGQDTQSTLTGLGAVFHSSPAVQSATAEELGQELDDEDYLTHVDNQLRDVFEDSQHDANKGQDFLPLNKLVSLLDETKISQILQRAFHGEPERIKTLTSAIHGTSHQNSRRMIFAVLILIGKVICIEDFTQNDIRDIHLPLRLHKDKQRRGMVHIQKRSASEVICLDRWKWSDMESFTNTQYRVLAPFFDMPPNDVHFYKIDDGRIILPFLECEKKTSGGYGTVWKVRIHPAHHNFVDSNGHQSTNPYFAIKEIHSDDYEAYKQEVRVLERFSGPNPGHEHLIRLRVAFQYAKNYYLLFDWAHGNLVNLWERTPNPTPSPELAHWLIKQCLGIADGLRKIHHHGSWYTGKNSNGTAHPEDADKNRGRHGDIKPENILCFLPPGHRQHHLVVSDFGLTRFHSSKSVSRVPRDKVLGYSRTYRAPEFDTQRYISQAYDMWSLGCLYLEFVSWFLVGYEATRGVETVRKTFQNIRVGEDNALDTVFQEDKFFNLKSRYLDPSNTHDAEVKDCVLKWIDDLQGQNNCSQCIRDFLHHIKHSLLVPNPIYRHKIDKFHAHLTEIHKLCELSIGYCDPPQMHAPDGTENDVPVIDQPTEIPIDTGEATDNAEDLTLILGELKKLGTNRDEKRLNTPDANTTIDETIRFSHDTEITQGISTEILHYIVDDETPAPPANGYNLDGALMRSENTSPPVCHSEVIAVLTHDNTDLTTLSLASGHSDYMPADTPCTTQGSEPELFANEADPAEPQSSSALEHRPPFNRKSFNIMPPLPERELSKGTFQPQWMHHADGTGWPTLSKPPESTTQLEDARYLGVNEKVQQWEGEADRTARSLKDTERGLQGHVATTTHQGEEPGQISKPPSTQKTELEIIPPQKVEPNSDRPSDVTIVSPDIIEPPAWRLRKSHRKKWRRVREICRRLRQFLTGG